MTSIGLNDVSAKLAADQVEIRGAIERVLASGQFVLGAEVGAFERMFAEYLGSGHCVGVANGTDAIELALRAVGMQQGDCIATVANAGGYASTSILRFGAEPVFMDVDNETRAAPLHEVERVLAMGVGAVVVTHLFGLAIPWIAEIGALCAKAGVPLIEDCAQAHGARVEGRAVGTFGAAGAFSFYPTKNLGALGDGGAVVTNCPNLARRLVSLRQYGWTSKYCVETAGGRNSRLDEIQAAILRSLLPRLNVANQRRREIARRYAREIRHTDVLVPSHRYDESYVAHLYVVSSPTRDRLQEYLRGKGIGCGIHYPLPDHRQPVFEDRYRDLRLPTTERLAEEILTLPCYPQMSDAAVEGVVEAINSWR